MAIKDLKNIASMNVNDGPTENEDSLETVQTCSVYIVEFLTTVCSIPFTIEEMKMIIQSLTALCRVDSDTTQLWIGDFNYFVSKETGLAASYNVRDQVSEFFTSLSDPNLSLMFDIVSQDIVQNTSNHQTLESLLYLLQCILLNDDEITGQNIIQSSQSLIENLRSELVSSELNEVTLARLILIIPKVLDKFIDVLPDIKSLTSS